MAQTTTPARQRGTKTFLKRGSDAMQALKQEQAKAEANRAAGQNRGPLRFYVEKDARGGYNEHELVFLDDDLTQAPFAYEHTIAGPGNDWKKSRTFVCVDEFDDCALCRAAEQGLAEEFTPARYGMYATVLDMTPYTIKKGTRAGEVIEATRKLIVIPHQQAGQFLKMAELCKTQNGGTTRGMVVVVTKTQQTDARCGIPQMLDNGMLFDFMSEDELEEYANDEVRRDNKVIKAEGEDIEPLDYEKLLAPLDQKSIRALFNIPAPPGSEDEEQANTGSSRRARRRRVVDEGPEQEGQAQGDDEEDEAESPPPATTAASGRTRRRAAAPEPEPEQPSRRRRRAGGAGDDIPFEG